MNVVLSWSYFICNSGSNVFIADGETVLSQGQTKVYFSKTPCVLYALVHVEKGVVVTCLL